MYIELSPPAQKGDNSLAVNFINDFIDSSIDCTSKPAGNNKKSIGNQSSTKYKQLKHFKFTYFILFSVFFQPAA